eukprot:COSAG02_NODE_27867_length_601_cov_0.782869_1_plen_164_part_10
MSAGILRTRSAILICSCTTGDPILPAGVLINILTLDPVRTRVCADEGDNRGGSMNALTDVWHITGNIGGFFLHNRHKQKSQKELPRLAGWWGHQRSSRFQMDPKFIPIEGAFSKCMQQYTSKRRKAERRLGAEELAAKRRLKALEKRAVQMFQGNVVQAAFGCW